MPLARCPYCSLVLLDHESRGAACPGCHGDLGNAVSAAPSRPVAPWRALVVCAAVLMLSVGALVAWVAWPRQRQEEPERPDLTPVALKPSPKPAAQPPAPKPPESAGELLDEPHVEAVEESDESGELLPPPKVEREPVAATPGEHDR